MHTSKQKIKIKIKYFLYFVLGFTIGDEYMLNESLTIQDSDRRRSVSPNQAVIGIQQLRQLHQAVCIIFFD